MVKQEDLKLIEIGKDDDNILSFKTYKTYINCLGSLIKNKYGDKFIEEFKAKLPPLNDISRNNDIDNEKIKSLLMNSWHTELNFLLPTTINTGLTKYSFHWAPVQAYYSLYLGMRAVFESSNINIKNTHEPTLRTISNWIVDRKVFPYPLNCYCLGIRDLKNIRFIGFETEVTDEKVKEITALSMPPDDELELCFAKFLKTTREKQFQNRKEKCGLKNKSGKNLKRFTVKDKTTIEKKLHKTTLFDCLYRLRIKSNYEEAETYILSEM